MSSREFIDRKRSGTSTKAILEEIEGSVDATLVRAKLLKDLRAVTFEDVNVSLSGDTVIVGSSNSDVKTVVDTYSRVYPEISFLFEIQDNVE